MKLLLDTHIWLWSILDPSRLRPRVVRTLEDQKNELWLSPISIWELLVLVRKGRLSLNLGVEEWIELAFQTVPLKEAPMTYDVAREANRIKLIHGDPADRFLLATARVFELTLVTVDERLIREKAASIFPNR